MAIRLFSPQRSRSVMKWIQFRQSVDGSEESSFKASERVWDSVCSFSDLRGPRILQQLVGRYGAKPFHLTPLPYGFDALEPFIDRETLYWHHDVHHRAYVELLNEVLSGIPGVPSWQGVSLESILRCVSRLPVEVRSCAGGHWNHSFFWNLMTDRKEYQEISSPVLRMIESNFESLENFKAQFIHYGSLHFGSGWIWLLRTGPYDLTIATTGDQDNPIMDDSEIQGVPLLACDLWEHAYYLNYKARRELYLRRFFSVVNWALVHEMIFDSPY